MQTGAGGVEREREARALAEEQRRDGQGEGVLGPVPAGAEAIVLVRRGQGLG